ncbi:spindle and kinetochore-associated protein 3 isoform X2 [Anabas testudineus]|uniref:spindle and kinetochore-associated protein 3 isoform X2 n=1 Tax=Anabas testudineus TaxID=64144 RepID=UPI000E45900F|nr:spindle and kinetochore-associated protein 3 isoform X2 [Anabas testudineus]
MDPTRQFFTKLRRLAMTLESETAKLQQAFENRNNDDDSDTTARAMRAYHELNCEVGDLKGQVQGHLAQQKAQVNEVSSIINAGRLMEKRITEDIQVLRTHWQKYGYQAPQRPNQTKSQDPEVEVADEDETKSTGEGEGSQEEAGGNCSSTPPQLGPPPFTDMLRTPQLSDFGLSEMQLKRTLAGTEWCSEVPPMPEMNLPHPALNTPAPPPMPITPKCALRMDDDELQTPQMHDFGITEHTMCLNNDFTMNLFQKNIEKPQRPSQDIPEPPVNSVTEGLQRKDDFESPEPPVFCTPGFKIKKTNGHCSPPRGTGEPESPGFPAILPTTPEVPAFQTPYVNRLVSSKKSARQTGPINVKADDDSDTFELSTPPQKGTTASKRTWEYNVPELSLMGVEDRQIPEMPSLESVLGNSLQSKNAKILKKASEFEKTSKEPTVSLELDGPTQEFSLGTPRIRMDYQEPSTPEMPDLSSVTQDICKLVSQAQSKKTSMAVVHPHMRPEKEKTRTLCLSVVSEPEFQSLPSYLKQMTLHSLNQAVHNINKFTEEHHGERTELQMEELRKITNVGTKTPVYILCLTELKRLKHVGGTSNTSLYKLCTKS